MSQVIRFVSEGETETRKLPWGLQERAETGVWFGDVSTRTHEVSSLYDIEWIGNETRSRYSIPFPSIPGSGYSRVHVPQQYPSTGSNSEKAITVRASRERGRI